MFFIRISVLLGPLRVVTPVDDRNALLQDLQAKRESINRRSSASATSAIGLNDGTKQHSLHRDDLNGQVRAIVERANQHKAKRDELNAKVHAAKAKRDELNKEAHARARALQALRKDRAGSSARRPDRQAARGDPASRIPAADDRPHA